MFYAEQLANNHIIIKVLRSTLSGAFRGNNLEL